MKLVLDAHPLKKWNITTIDFTFHQQNVQINKNADTRIPRTRAIPQAGSQDLQFSKNWMLISYLCMLYAKSCYGVIRKEQQQSDAW